MPSAALRRVTELFIEGRECVLDEQEPVLVWVNKLNPFEVDEARRDGQAARTSFTLALEDPRSEESQLFDLQGKDLTDDVVAEALAGAKYQEDMLRATDDIRADEEWTEKVNLLDRGSETLIANRPPEDAERQMFDRLTQEYFVELDNRVAAMREQRVADFKALPHDELRAAYRKAWIEERATGAFLTEYRISELYYSLRECKSPGRDGNGRWQHTLCDHRAKLLEDRAEVRMLPRGLVEKVRPILNDLAVDERSAKDSPEPPSSSDSSREPNGQADSEPSGQDKTPPAPVTTSTSRSTTH